MNVLESNESGIYLVGEKKYNFNVGILKHSHNKSDIWQMTNNDENFWIEKIKSNKSFFIGEKFKVRVGVKSCADNVFIKEDWGKEKFRPEEELFKKLISQENIQRWCFALDNNLKILYPHYSENGKRLVIELINIHKQKRILKFIKNNYQIGNI